MGAALPQPYTMDEAAVDRYKPWAYANLVNSVTLLMGEDSLEDPLAVDTYIYNKAVSSGVTVDAVESYVYQGELFDSLSGPYQAGYLSGARSGFQAAQRGDMREAAMLAQKLMQSHEGTTLAAQLKKLFQK